MKKLKFKLDNNWLLLLILGLFILLNYRMVVSFKWFPQDDAGEHLVKSIKAFHYLKSGDFAKFFWGDALYPPLMYQISAIFYLFFPPGIVSGVLSQWPYWAILIFSLYGAGRRLFSKTTGLLAVFYYLSAPITLLWCYQYMMDLPCAALLALAWYLLLKTENFKNPWYSMAFGLTLGLGMLLKWWVGYLLLGTLLYYFIRVYLGFIKDNYWRLGGILLAAALLGGYFFFAAGFKPAPDPYHSASFWRFFRFCAASGLLFWLLLAGFLYLAEKAGRTDPAAKEPAWNFLGAMSLALLVCGWLYFNPYFALLNGNLFKYGSFITPEGWPAWDYYPRALWLTALRPVYLLFLVTGIVVFLGRKKFSPPERLYLLTSSSALLLLALLPNKQERYLLLWLVFAAPLAVFWIEKSKKAAWALIIILLATGSLYLTAGWLIKAESAQRNPLLGWLLLGKQSLAERGQGLRFPEDCYRQLLAPLPQKGEKVLFFDYSGLPLDYFHCYPVLNGLNYEILTPQNNCLELSRYQYLLYPQKSSADEGELRAHLKTNPRFSQADAFLYRQLSACRIPGSEYVIRLAKIVPRKAGMKESEVVRYWLEELAPSPRIFLLDPAKHLEQIRIYLSAHLTAQLKDSDYLLYSTPWGKERLEVYRQLQESGLTDSCRNFDFIPLKQYHHPQSNRTLVLAQVKPAELSLYQFLAPLTPQSRILLLDNEVPELAFLRPLLSQSGYKLPDERLVKDFDWVIYLTKKTAGPEELQAVLQTDRSFPDAGAFSFLPVSRYSLDKTREIRICQVKAK